MILFLDDNRCPMFELTDACEQNGVDVCDGSLAVICEGLGFELVNSSECFRGRIDAVLGSRALIVGKKPSTELLCDTCNMRGLGDGFESTVVEMVYKGSNIDYAAILKAATDLQIKTRQYARRQRKKREGMLVVWRRNDRAIADQRLRD